MKQRQAECPLNVLQAYNRQSKTTSTITVKSFRNFRRHFLKINFWYNVCFLTLTAPSTGYYTFSMAYCVDRTRPQMLRALGVSCSRVRNMPRKCVVGSLPQNTCPDNRAGFGSPRYPSAIPVFAATMVKSSKRFVPCQQDHIPADGTLIFP